MRENCTSGDNGGWHPVRGAFYPLKAEKQSQTEDFRNDMRLRGRIEAKNHELVNTYGLRRVRYMGSRNLAFAARLKALAANLQKLNRTLARGEYSKTRFKDLLAEHLLSA